MTDRRQLRELQKRLEREPDNLGLRVMVAGALREAGQRAEAVELYRSVAFVYRDQGRSQQALAVCRSLLEIAPDDAACRALIVELTESVTPIPEAPGRPSTPSGMELRVPLASVPAPPSVPTIPAVPSIASGGVTRGALASAAASGVPIAPVLPPDSARWSASEATPLPAPLPYHEAYPTSSVRRISVGEDGLISDGLITQPEIALGSGVPREPSHSGAMGASGSGSLLGSSDSVGLTTHDEDLAAELDTRQRRRIEARDLDKIASPPTEPVPLVDPRLGHVAIDDHEAEADVATGVGEGARIRRATAAGAAVRGARDVGDDELTNNPAADEDWPDELTRPRDMLAPGQGPLGGAFFSPIPLEARAGVLARFVPRRVAAGAIVIRQGEVGRPLFVVIDGELELRVERLERPGVPISLGTLGAGEFIGEGSLLTRTPAAAQVVARTATELLELAPTVFYELAAAYPALWAALKAVAEHRQRLLDGRLRKPPVAPK